MRDAPNTTETAYLGHTVRIEVPLRSVTALRKIAEELHGLATNLEHLSRRKNSPGELMLEVRSAVSRCNKKMAAARGRGRPRKNPVGFES